MWPHQDSNLDLEFRKHFLSSFNYLKINKLKLNSEKLVNS